ncbi:hypothetical protein A3K73_04960 [Candidatus Pacearchaeota archaeon RBG_13_36_9]|nr:MAG: hypothetical protein A3K73_04960 [Candidatus Pacearchaeota archaeon RBG_13_36_9]
MEIVMSGHALKQARERGVSINEIKDAIKCGAKSLQNGKIISAYRHVKIVFKKQEDKFFIITVMIRSEKNGK